MAKDTYDWYPRDQINLTEGTLEVTLAMFICTTARIGVRFCSSGSRKLINTEQGDPVGRPMLITGPLSLTSPSHDATIDRDADGSVLNLEMVS